MKLDEVQLAYATGIPCCGHPADNAALHVAGKNLIYTAVTKGKKLVTIIGQPKALAMAV